MYASEVLVFAEYAEFACAFIYGLYTFILFHYPYAKYSLCFIGLSESEFWDSVLNCAVYTALEGFTLIVFFVSVRRKFGISPLYQLAFVLEKYWMSVQGKITTSLVLVFILHTVHQGTDLSLEFNWEHLLNGHNH
ncbi:hypothetical protein V7S43_012953 [Phytophthora oleae]|uniref:Uncharacterized protein n=1 Tax=Phytophthora oleae TaxID=2107226 RepID=A0ABD3F5Z7_9STRA